MSDTLIEAPEALDESKFVTFDGSPFQLYQPYSPAGDQPEAIKTLVEGIEDGLSFQTLLGVTGSGKTFTMANVIARMGRPAIVFAPNKTLAAQLYAGIPRVFPAQRRRVFRLVLRLLPAGSVRSAARPVHRKGLVDQRAHRADAPVRHQEPAGAARRGDRGDRFGDLRYRQSVGISQDDSDAAHRRQARPARHHRAPDRDAVQPQRSRFPARLVSRARRHDRYFPGGARRNGGARRAFRRRNRVDAALRSAHRAACGTRFRASPSIRRRIT